jgi:uracil-DNA glycosylase
MMLVGEARGEQEDRYNSSFIGGSGALLLRMLADAKIIKLTGADHSFIDKWYRQRNPLAIKQIWEGHPEVYRTNVFQHHPPGNDLSYFCGPKAEAIPGYPPLTKSKYVHAQWAPELTRLGDEILAVNPNIIICLGNTALWALAGRVAITKIRGTTLMSTHCVEGYKLLPTFHPAAVLRQYEQKPTVIADLIKAKRESETINIERPHREIWIEPTLADIKAFIAEHIHGCKLLSVDIETYGSRVTCIGFAPSERIGIVIPFDDSRRPDGSYWATASAERECWAMVREVLVDKSIPKLFQNGLYDISFLLRAYGIGVMGAEHDTMLLMHALQPESLKGLGYQGSLFTNERAWKELGKRSKTIKRGA